MSLTPSLPSPFQPASDDLTTDPAHTPVDLTSPRVIGPVLGQERIEAIDILRGVAILGILIVNMGGFSLPEDLPAHQLWPNLVDRAVEKLILFFAQEKFLTLFSFLF